MYAAILWQCGWCHFLWLMRMTNMVMTRGNLLKGIVGGGCKWRHQSEDSAIRRGPTLPANICLAWTTPSWWSSSLLWYKFITPTSWESYFRKLAFRDKLHILEWWEKFAWHDMLFHCWVTLDIPEISGFPKRIFWYNLKFLTQVKIYVKHYR